MKISRKIATYAALFMATVTFSQGSDNRFFRNDTTRTLILARADQIPQSVSKPAPAPEDSAIFSVQLGSEEHKYLYSYCDLEDCSDDEPEINNGILDSGQFSLSIPFCSLGDPNYDGLEINTGTLNSAQFSLSIPFPADKFDDFVRNLNPVLTTPDMGASMGWDYEDASGKRTRNSSRLKNRCALKTSYDQTTGHLTLEKWIILNSPYIGTYDLKIPCSANPTPSIYGIGETVSLFRELVKFTYGEVQTLYDFLTPGRERPCPWGDRE